MTKDTAPQDLNAEENVIGAMLVSEKAIEAAVEECRPDDFYRASHGTIFQVAAEMHARHEAVDFITIKNELEHRKLLSKVGGEQRVIELARMVPATANVRHHARIVREHAGARALMTAGHEIAKLGRDRPGNLDELSEQAEKHLSVALAPTVKTQFDLLSAALPELVDAIEEATRTGRPMVGTLTGYIDLDKILTGLHPGTLTVIAARPAMGKSALGLNIAENIADREGPVGILSLEMSRRELLLRSLSRACAIDSQQFRLGLTPDELERFRRNKLQVQTRPVYIEDSSSVSSATLRAEARRLHRHHGLKVLIVDYLQLLLSGKTQDSREQEVAQISRSLKLIARELDIPVIALAQLNRKLEERADKRPMLSDLRDSGAIEQDADVVLFIYRDDYYSPESDQQGIAEVIVAKNRMGPSGTAKLAFVARHSAFKDLAKGMNR